MEEIRRARVLLAGLAAVALATLARPAGDPCFGDDLLAGVCDAPTQVQLPDFEGFELEALGMRWDACGLSESATLSVEVDTPLWIGCGRYVAPLVVRAPSSVPLAHGTLWLTYLETWEEVAAGGLRQVWRLAAKVDLFGTGLEPSAAVPTCAEAGLPAFFYGHLDVALNCANLQRERALVLFHASDRYVHAPVLSAVPGDFHPGVAHGIVAPHDGTNSFVPADSVSPAPPSGPMLAGGLRNAEHPFAPGTCAIEEQGDAGTAWAVATGCTAPPDFDRERDAVVLFNGLTECGPPGTPGLVASLDAFPIVPWVHLFATGLGAWSGPGFPGDERVWAVEGVCAVRTDGLVSSDIVYGTASADGFLVLPWNGELAPTTSALGLTSNASFAAGQTIAFPVLGRVGPTTHIVRASLP